jgi:hypothetical protein
MTLTYSSAIFQGTELKKKQVQEYVSRRKEPKKRYRRRSTFGVGSDGEKWVNYQGKRILSITRGFSTITRLYCCLLRMVFPPVVL